MSNKGTVRSVNISKEKGTIKEPVGQILVDQLREEGCDMAFCVPGESFLAALGLKEPQLVLRVSGKEHTASEGRFRPNCFHWHQADLGGHITRFCLRALHPRVRRVGNHTRLALEGSHEQALP